MRITGDLLIGSFKLIKAAVLFLVSAGVLSLLDAKVRSVAEQHITQLSGDPHFHALQRVASYLGFASPHKIEFIGIASFFYATLFAVEGIGLLSQKRWAEFFTAIVTASFLPLEVYEIARKPGAFKIAILVVNIAVVIYLILKLRVKMS